MAAGEKRDDALPADTDNSEDQAAFPGIPQVEAPGVQAPARGEQREQGAELDTGVLRLTAGMRIGWTGGHDPPLSL